MPRNLFTASDDEFIRQNFTTMSNAEIAEALDRTPSTIGKRASRLNIKRPSTYSEAEDEYLRNNHKEKTHAELAEHLGKTKGSINTRLKKLKLKKGKPRFKNKNGTPREGYQYILHSDWETMLDTPCPLLIPCQSCKSLKPVTDFFKYSNKSKSGFVDILDQNRYSICPKCNLENYIQKDDRQKMLDNAKARARRDQRDFSLSIEDIIIPDRCPILGIELKPEVGAGRNNSPSENDHAPQLDRIDSSKGYVKGNVCVISTKANVQKKNGTAMEFLAITAFLIEARNKISTEIDIKVPYGKRPIEELIQIVKDFLHES